MAGEKKFKCVSVSVVFLYYDMREEHDVNWSKHKWQPVCIKKRIEMYETIHEHKMRAHTHRYHPHEQNEKIRHLELKSCAGNIIVEKWTIPRCVPFHLLKRCRGFVFHYNFLLCNMENSVHHTFCSIVFCCCCSLPVDVGDGVIRSC